MKNTAQKESNIPWKPRREIEHWSKQEKQVNSERGDSAMQLHFGDWLIGQVTGR
jgi:hypothetical protein